MVLALLALLPGTAGAWASSFGPGSTDGDFLRLEAAPRAGAMGGAFTGLADDAGAFIYNPAGLAGLQRQEASLAHAEVFTGVRQEWLAYAYPGFGWGALGFSITQVHVEPFDTFETGDVPGGESSSQETAYSAAYARRWGRRLSLGAAFKLLHSRFDAESSDFYAFDAGAAFQPSERLRLGLAVLNLGPDHRVLKEDFPLPMTGRAGLSFKVLRQEGRLGSEHELTAAADVVGRSDHQVYAAGGVEYLRHKVLAFRAGYRGDREGQHGLTLGVGVYLNYGLRGRLPELIADYAWLNSGRLAQSHRVGLTLKFGAMRWRRPWEAEEPAAEAGRPKPPRPRPAQAPAEAPPAPERRRTDVLLIEP